MADSIEDEDVRRVDENIDPTALTQGDIESELPDDFEGDARDAFSERVSEQRNAVQECVDLSKRISRNPANNEPQIRNEKGQFAANADEVTGTTLESDGGYYAEVEGGDRVRIDTVDLQAGADGQRRDEW